jgi:hypothetical protein
MSSCKPHIQQKNEESDDEADDSFPKFHIVAAIMKKDGIKPDNWAKKAQQQRTQSNYSQNQQSKEREVLVDDALDNFFGLQIVGLSDSLDPSENDEVLKQFKANLVFAEGRYQCGLPWNERIVDLPTNYKQAKARLKSTLRQLKQKPEYLKQYQAILDEQLSRGIIEIVTDPSKSLGPVHYLPHRAVIREDHSTTKVRIVMDGSARPRSVIGAPSLNECLYPGPILLNDLTGILLRWRQMPIVILADIEKAFLMVGVKPQDRDATRFLWVINAQEVDEDNLLYEHCIVYRFTRVSFGLNCSPFLLNATIKQHLEFFDSDVSTKIQQNLYVDNVMIACDHYKNIVQFCKEAQDIFAAAGMRLREFMCNVPRSLTEMKPEDTATHKETIKVLGIYWNLNREKIVINFPFFNGHLTKRTILAYLASIYDPQGLVSPVLLTGKLFLQKLWASEKKWDDNLPLDLQSEWSKLMDSWNVGTDPPVVEFHRYIGSMKEMHTFADASGTAMGIAIFLVTDCFLPHLIFAKSLVKPVKLPIKAGTIPKLELQALAIAVKVSTFVRDQIHIPNDKITLWTDSKCCIDQLKVISKQDRFVDNRLRKIRGNWPVNHVISSENPADIASRGINPMELQNSSLWKHGPKWLGTPDKWPEILVQYNPGEEILVEIKDEATHELSLLPIEEQE